VNIKFGFSGFYIIKSQLSESKTEMCDIHFMEAFEKAVYSKNPAKARGKSAIFKNCKFPS